MQSLPEGYRALVIGASGALGSAFVQQLQSGPRCGSLAALHRASVPAIDYARDGSIADAAVALRSDGPLHLVLVATGVLHGPALAPEKRLADLDAAALETLLRTNTIGPALVLRHFAPLLDRQRSLLGVLSAKLGSIGDNRLGGWYGYRASKAALRPGTVRSALSRPFRGDAIGRELAQAAAEMLAVLDGLQAEDSGAFVAYSGERLP